MPSATESAVANARKPFAIAPDVRSLALKKPKCYCKQQRYDDTKHSISGEADVVLATMGLQVTRTGKVNKALLTTTHI